MALSRARLAAGVSLLVFSVPQAANAQAPAPVDRDTIVVTGARATRTARDEERIAPNLIDIQAAEDIVKYPDFNAAEALGRIPGVSLAIDTGEGRFVNIRGIDGNLNGTTFGGVTLLNTQPGGTYFGGGGRAVELDTIPIGAIDRLVVRKTGLPDQEAEGLGGSVELTPRTAVGVKAPFVEGTIGGGYQPARKSADIFVAEATVGTTFGPDRTLALLLNGSFHTDKRGFDDIEPGFVDAGPPFQDVTLDAADLRRYNYHRRRFGFGGELTWDPDARSHYYVRLNNAGYTESVNRQLLQYRGLGDTITRAGNVVTATGVTARTTLRDEQETHLNFVAAAGGRNDIGGVVVDYQAAYTSSTYHRDYDYGSRFDSNQAFTVAYDNITRPDYPRFATTGFIATDASQYTLKTLTNATERAFDREYSGVLNLTVPTRLFGGSGQFKVGAKLRLRDKIDQPNSLSYAVPKPAPSLAQLQGPGPFLFYYNQNNIGYAPDAGKLRAVFAGITPTVNAGRNAGGFFNDTENIYAGYVQYSATFDQLSVLAGVRVERTEATYRGIGQLTDAAGNTTFPPTSRRSNYTNFFPTVQLRYSVTPQLVARATYSTGIGRPGFLQLNSGASVDVGAQTVSVGNPALRPTTVDAFDASLEYYLPNSGVVSIGVFDKAFKDYALQRTTIDNNFPGIAGKTVVSTFSNVNNAHARGIEAQYTQKFTQLPGLLGGLGFTGNITYVDSRVQIRGDINNPSEFGQLPGTSPLTYNIGGFYEADRVQLRLSFQHVDAAIFGVGGAAGLDVFEAARNTLDFTSSYQLTPQFGVYFNAKNLTDSPLRYYEGSSNRTIQREYYRQSYEAGARFKF